MQVVSLVGSVGVATHMVHTGHMGEMHYIRALGTVPSHVAIVISTQLLRLGWSCLRLL